MAEELLPGDAYLLTNIATYYTALGDKESGLRYLDQAAQHGSDDPIVIANIAEAYEDLGDRENALEWVRRAVEVGTKSSRFEDSPSLRNLVADGRYRELFNESIN